jgi:phage terminase Nu1 subunit (DNA packaging protein)
MSAAGNPTYPAKTIAKLLMLTPRRVQQLAKEGIISKSERGRYELGPAVQGYIRYLQARAVGNVENAGSIDYHVEKARKTKFEADIAEVEASKRRGDAIDAIEVKRAWQLILGEIRANLLGSTPQRIASRIVGLEGEAQIKRIIRDEIALAMAAAADTDVQELFGNE